MPISNPAAKYTFVGNLGQATAAVAYKFGKTIGDANRDQTLKSYYSELASRLSLPDLQASDIIFTKDGHPMFGTKPLPSAVGPVALLWARYTGTNSLTGYNPEGDSSVQGQTQLKNLLKDMGWNVITIGHGPRGGNAIKSDFDVGEFYLQRPVTTNRASQTSFFLALMQTYPGRLYQIGQKTGGMDCAALLGVPTLYLEHKASHSFHRMQKWVDKVPFYKHSVIELPPSRIGASLRMTFDEIKDFTELYKFGQPKAESQQRASAKTRFACMVYKYPKEMEESRMTIQAVVDWTNTRKANQFAEVPNNPDADGGLAKKIRSVNLNALGAGPVGYTDYRDPARESDLDRIKKQLESLYTEYSKKTTVIRTAAGKYETRWASLSSVLSYNSSNSVLCGGYDGMNL